MKTSLKLEHMTNNKESRYEVRKAKSIPAGTKTLQSLVTPRKNIHQYKYRKNHEMPQYCNQIQLNTHTAQIVISSKHSMDETKGDCVCPRSGSKRNTCTTDPISLKLKKDKSTVTKIRTMMRKQEVHDRGA